MFYIYIFWKKFISCDLSSEINYYKKKPSPLFLTGNIELDGIAATGVLKLNDSFIHANDM